VDKCCDICWHTKNKNEPMEQAYFKDIKAF